jgi:hypothetical protein
VVSYQTDVVPILQTRCIGCHNVGAATAGYKYETYNSTLTSVNDRSLIGSITYESGFTRMPYNLNKMQACEIEIIEFWINQGAKNN